MTKNIVFIIDGTYYLYRAYYALPLLTNSKGEPTGVIYGIYNMLYKILKQYKPSHMVVVFDAKEKTFRHDLFKKYKINRPPMPYVLSTQIKPLYRIIKAMGIRILIVSGVEADDVIGTIAKFLEKKGDRIFISTGDKDITQLVTSKIKMMNIVNNTLYGPNEVKKKYGVPPYLIADLLALMGDSSDNIPGIPGIGIKTAHKLLKEIGSIKQIYLNIDKVAQMNIRGAKSVAMKLIQHKELAFISSKLTTIKTDIKIQINFKEMIVKKPDIEKLLLLFNHYDIKKKLNNGSITNL